MTDDGPDYHALSVHLRRAKLTTRFDDRYAEAKFSKSGVPDKFPEGSTIILEIPEFPFNTLGQTGGSTHAENQLDSFSRYRELRLVTDTDIKTDRQTQGHN